MGITKDTKGLSLLPWDFSWVTGHGGLGEGILGACGGTAAPSTWSHIRKWLQQEQQYISILTDETQVSQQQAWDKSCMHVHTKMKCIKHMDFVMLL